MVDPGNPTGSRLVEVIATGEMPKGNTKVTEAEFKVLKRWLEEGAKFDGPDRNMPLVQFARSAESSSAADMHGQRQSGQSGVSRAPLGDETVSYGRDIAPILMKNCNGCHIGGMRARGGLQFDTFRQLIQGGDSGPLIEGPDPNTNLLVKRIKGEEGERMPAGRDPLSTDEIELISQWIREGATFDGPTERENIEVTIGQSWAKAASDEDLFARRKERSLAKFMRVLPTIRRPRSRLTVFSSWATFLNRRCEV